MRFSHLTKSLGFCAVGALMAANATAQCPAVDAMEPNDDCLTAPVLANGTYTGLTVHGQASGAVNDDYFSVTVPAGEDLVVDCLFIHATADVDVYFYNPATSPFCGGEATTDYLVRGFSATDNEHVVYSNTTGAPLALIVRVELYSASATCNDYDLVIATTPTPPGPCSVPDDSYEENDFCGAATAMVDGTYPGLFTQDGDEDYYEVTLADLDTLTVDIAFIDANGDLDLEFYESQADCAIDAPAVGSYGVVDGESVSYTNTTGSTLTIVIHVYHWTGDAASPCNSYDMTINGSGGSFATSMCEGDGSVAACPCGNESTLGAGEGCKSSVGVGAILTAGGSASVAADDITFSVAQARPNQTSMLLQGATLISVPFKDGRFCMGNPTERIQVVFLDAAGAGSTTTSVVTEGAVAPGNTRYYQHWFRDPGGVSPCGNGSNFSNGLTVVYLP